MDRVEFKKITAPDKKTYFIPNGIRLEFPSNSKLPADKLHYLANIPWSEEYIKNVPIRYRKLFNLALPYPQIRTTDVHTAICLSLLGDLLERIDQPFDEQVVYVGLILHDSGWSKLSEEKIADSLSYKGLALSEQSLGPKREHAEQGVKIVREVLTQYEFSPPLNKDQAELIEYIVLHHDIPKHIVETDSIPLELYLVCDSDRFWSYTHECFWQDTVRKNVEPDEYLNNLGAELDGYFYTPQGKEIARKLLKDRKKEVEQYPT